MSLASLSKPMLILRMSSLHWMRRYLKVYSLSPVTETGCTVLLPFRMTSFFGGSFWSLFRQRPSMYLTGPRLQQSKALEGADQLIDFYDGTLQLSFSETRLFCRMRLVSFPVIWMSRLSLSLQFSIEVAASEHRLVWAAQEQIFSCGLKKKVLFQNEISVKSSGFLSNKKISQKVLSCGWHRTNSRLNIALYWCLHK